MMRSRFSESFCLSGFTSGMLFAPWMRSRLSQRPPLDALFIIHTLNNALHIHAGCVYLVGIDLAGLNQMLDLRNRNLRCSRHHGIEVTRGLAIHQVAPAVT